MATKDYYSILGLARNESQAGIRAAYRDIARQRHPDWIPETPLPGFHDFIEAYNVLSDNRRKLAYDGQLSRFEAGQTGEPIIEPTRSPVEIGADSIMRDVHSVHPSLDELQERIIRNFTGREIPKAERPQSLTVQVILHSEEAVLGGVVPIGIPVYEDCSVCRGMRPESFFPCPRCDGAGFVETTKTVAINVPPRVAPGTMFESSLDHLGIENLFLRVFISVAH